MDMLNEFVKKHCLSDNENTAPANLQGTIVHKLLVTSTIIRPENVLCYKRFMNKKLISIE